MVVQVPVYPALLEKKRKGEKAFAVLIDPDKVSNSSIVQIVELALAARVDYFFVGGSLVISDHLDDCIRQIKLPDCLTPLSLCNGERGWGIGDAYPTQPY